MRRSPTTPGLQIDRSTSSCAGKFSIKDLKRRSVHSVPRTGKPSLLNGLGVTLRSYAVSSSMYDIAIIGGGPAGSTAAALLARAGRRVVLFERENFPRFHIGESLLPFSMKAFTRLGLHEKFLSAGFIKKYGGEIMGACSDTGTKFYFKDGYRSQTDHAYQVTRGDFDKVLLDHARESGAHVHEQTAVDGIDFSYDGIQLGVRSEGSFRSFRVRYRVEAG